jgi:nucleotide-binding universal stress UspA family protein
MNILLAIDSSPSSEAVVTEVQIRPWPPKSKFCVLHVFDTFTLLPGRTAAASAIIESGLQASDLLVKSVRDKLASCGLDVMTDVIKGYPPSAIVEYASKWAADFVFVGSHGLGRVKRFLLGSTAQTVVRHAPCSVEIVRDRTEKLKLHGGALRILLATDGSDFSRAAAQSIAKRPWPSASEVKVVSVFHVAESVTDRWSDLPEEIALIESEILHQGEEDVDAARKIVADAGLKVTTSVLKGYPKSVIVDEAERWGADLVVVGSHGRRGFSRLFMGSVSEAVAMHAHCSVEVIRDRDLFKD